MIDRCLVIDIGNTRTKAAHFQEAEIRGRYAFGSGEFLSRPELWDTLPGGFPTALASVRPLPEQFLDFLSGRGTLLLVDGLTDLPFGMAYRSRHTLGPDRVALAAGAIDRWPGQDLLVIDAGTCITYDLIEQGRTFRGGAIAPGIDMRLKAMHEQTARLPLAAKREGQFFPGDTTEHSLLAGALDGARAELAGTVERLRGEYPDLTVVLAGGDAPYFANYLKNSIFAGPDLILQGLRTILEHNVKHAK